MKMIKTLSIAKRLYILVAGGTSAVIGLTGLCAYTAVKMYDAATNVASVRLDLLGEMRDRLITTAGVVCISSLVIVLPVFWIVIRSILHRLRIARHALTQVSEGDLTQFPDIEGQDEIAQLQTAIQRMQLDLTSIIFGVREKSREMSEAVGEIATGNDDLSRRTEIQVASLQQTAANLHRMSEALSATAGGTEKAKELAARALNLSEESGTAVQSLVVRMRSIKRQSNRIAEIVSLIDSIAFQTNILALNAAVESARAGEVGRGFAVVAGEVRMLAGRCGTAAKEIGQLISETNAEIEKGAEAADSAGTAMERLTDAVRGASGLVDEINSTTTAQALELADIRLELGRVDDVTQQNAARVEQVAATASNVRAHACELVDSVEVFRLPDARE